jgi:hypothetical protein
MLVAVLVASLAGCGGGGAEGEPERAGNHVDPALEATLPDELGGVKLVSESFSGQTWLEVASIPRVDFGAWLDRLDKDAEDLTVAWCKSDSIKAFAFRVDGADGDEMLRTFVAGAAEADTTKQTISGKQFTLLKWPGDVRYNYVSGNTMYGLLPADASEAEALARQLP